MIKKLKLRGHIIDSLILSKLLDSLNNLGVDCYATDVKVGARREDVSEATFVVETDNSELMQKAIDYAKKTRGHGDLNMSEEILMCAPDYYGIEYEINPWMNIEIQSDRDKAVKQWNALYKILKEDLKVDVKLVEPQKGLPDMVFTANAAVMYKNKAIIAKFKYPQRQQEEAFFAQWFKDNGYEVIILPDDMAFEGAGDALYLDNILYSGYIPRSDIASHTYISELLGISVISLELVNKNFYHLDTCFCPLEGGYLVYYPAAFDLYANNVIAENVPPEKRIIVSDEEASFFTCNAVNIGKYVVTNLTTNRFSGLLEEKGFVHIQTDLSEYMKAGGAAKCLTLKI